MNSGENIYIHKFFNHIYDNLLQRFGSISTPNLQD